MKVFQEKLKELRKEQGLMQKSIAEILQTTNSSISDWECGRSQPDLATLVKIAVFFDVSVDYLLGLEDEMGVKIKPKID